MVGLHYHGQPGKDPYWGGMTLIGDYIYSLGIGDDDPPEPRQGVVPLL